FRFEDGLAEICVVRSAGGAVCEAAFGAVQAFPCGAAAAFLCAIDGVAGDAAVGVRQGGPALDSGRSGGGGVSHGCDGTGEVRGFETERGPVGGGWIADGEVNG